MLLGQEHLLAFGGVGRGRRRGAGARRISPEDGATGLFPRRIGAQPDPFALAHHLHGSLAALQRRPEEAPARWRRRRRRRNEQAGEEEATAAATPLSPNRRGRPAQEASSVAVAGGLRSRAEEGRRRLLLRGGWAGTVDQETQHAGSPEEAGPGPWRRRDLPPQGGAEVVFLRLLTRAFPRNNMAHIGSRATPPPCSARAFSERRQRSSASLTTWLPAPVPLLSPGPANTTPQLPGHGRKWLRLPPP